MPGITITPLHQKGDGVIAVSQELEQESIHRFGYEPSDVYLVPHGVNPENFSDENKVTFKDELSIKEDSLVITFVGSINKRKGIDLLLRACNLIKDQVPSFTLLIVGEGETEWMNEIIIQEGLQEVAKVFPFQDPVKFYKMADVFVLPSRKEAFGLVIIEAMMVGVPVIRSKTEGANDQILDKHDGLLFESENVEQLSECLIALLNNKNLREKIGMNGKMKAEKLFTQDVMVTNIIHVYQEIINKFHQDPV